MSSVIPSKVSTGKYGRLFLLLFRRAMKLTQTSFFQNLSKALFIPTERWQQCSKWQCLPVRRLQPSNGIRVLSKDGHQTACLTTQLQTYGIPHECYLQTSTASLVKKTCEHETSNAIKQMTGELLVQRIVRWDIMVVSWNSSPIQQNLDK